MKAVSFLISALILALSPMAMGAVGFPQQCVNSATNPTTAEWLTCTQARAGTSNTNPLYVAPSSSGGHTLADQYVYDGSNFVQMRAGLVNADAISTALTIPYSASFGLFYDGSAWDRVTGGTLADNLSRAPNVLYVGSFSLFDNGTNYQRAPGGTLADNLSAAPTVPYVGSFSLFSDGTNYRRLTGEAVDDSMTAAPVVPNVAAYGTFYDGSNQRRVTGEAFDSSMTAAPVNPNVNAFSTFYNGSASQYWLGGSAPSDALTAPAMPYVESFGMTRHGLTWDMMTSTTSADNLSATPQGVDNLSYTHFYNGTNFQRWTGESWDSSLTLTVAPTVIGLTSFYNGTAGQYWLGNTAGADDITNSTASPYTSSLTYAFDGTNFDRVRMSDKGNLHVVDPNGPTGLADDDNTGNCVAITASSVQYTLPAAGWFAVTAVNNAAYLLSGANPSIGSIAAGNFSMVVPDSATIYLRLTGPKVAVIGASAAGYICFVPIATPS